MNEEPSDFELIRQALNWISSDLQTREVSKLPKDLAEPLRKRMNQEITSVTELIAWGLSSPSMTEVQRSNLQYMLRIYAIRIRHEGGP